MSKKMKSFTFRRKLIKNQFFNSVVCNCKETKNSILDWMFNLYKSKNISIDHFSYIFIKYDIAFPIQISEIGWALFKITDDNGNNHILRYNTSYEENYSIERREYPFGKFINFKINELNDIILMKADIIQLRKNNTGKRENMLSFVYDYVKHFTTVGVKHAYQKHPYLKITYSLQNEEFDNEVLKLLCEITSFKELFNDVFDIFVGILDIGKIQTLSVKATYASNLLSEITLENGIVKSYSFTQKISESETCLHNNFISKKVDKFINEHLG